MISFKQVLIFLHTTQVYLQVVWKKSKSAIAKVGEYLQLGLKKSALAKVEEEVGQEYDLGHPFPPAAVAIWWKKFYQCNFDSQHRYQFSFHKVSSSLDNFQYIFTPSKRNYQRLPVLRSRVKCSRPSFPPICKLHWHTHTPLHLKHLKSSVCAVRVNSFCTFFAWFINFGNIYV